MGQRISAILLKRLLVEMRAWDRRHFIFVSRIGWQQKDRLVRHARDAGLFTGNKRLK